MKTYDIISEIKSETEIENNEVFDNYFADAVESANNYAIDSTAEAFNLSNVEFYEDGVSGIEDEELKEKVNNLYFSNFEGSLKLKAKGIMEEMKITQ